MSSGYSHLSKAGDRVLQRLRNTPKHLSQQMAKFQKISMPAFLDSGRDELEPEKQYKTMKDWMYLPGDRVVIVKGPKKGNVCVVKQHETRSNGYILDENGPTRTVPIPKEFWIKNQKSHIFDVPMAVGKEDLKLVVDLENDNKTRTVAVKDIVYNGSYYDKDYRKVMPIRTVSGAPDMVVPWPRPIHPEQPQETLGTTGDIARLQTFWVQSIKTPPIPEVAMPGIRNPKSRYRRGTLSARDISRMIAPKMPLTATKAAYLAEKKQLATVKRPQLTEEDKHLLGERLYQHLSSSITQLSNSNQ